MRIDNSDLTISLQHLIAELGSLVQDCTSLTQELEDAMSAALAQDKFNCSIPIIELQKIDLLRQLQEDIAMILSSEQLARKVACHKGNIDLQSLVEITKLEQVRRRFYALLGVQEEPQPSSDFPKNSNSTSDIDIF